MNNKITVIYLIIDFLLENKIRFLFSSSSVIDRFVCLFKKLSFVFFLSLQAKTVF